MLVSIIVAVAENGVIGNDNQLLWKLSDDLKRFKQLTSHHCIIMGRKTYESIGKALPNRKNLIISRNKNLHYTDTIIFNTLNDAIRYAESIHEEEVFIIGGGEIYKQALQFANKIYLTKVHTQIDGDTYFNFDIDEWIIIEESTFTKNEKNEYDSTFIILEKNSTL